MIRILITCVIVIYLGEGSYSQVFKVQRLSDDMIYALKKVTM